MRFRLFASKSLVVSIGMLLTTAIANAQSKPKSVSQTPGNPSVTDAAPGVIRPSDGLLTYEEAVRAQVYIPAHETEVHTAFVRVRVHFVEDRFNNAVYLSAFDDIKAELLDASGAKKQVYSASLSKNPTIDAGMASSIAKLEFQSRPNPGDRLVMTLGPLTTTHVLTDDTFKWDAVGLIDRGKRLPWSVAYADVLYAPERPDWLTITDAKLLQGRDGVSQLQVTVSNVTKEARPLLSMTLDASSPKTSRIKCRVGDKPQTATFIWEKRGSTARPAAETNLDAVQLPVPITFRLLGRCSSYTMEAIAPLSEEAPANATTVLSFRLKELPKTAKAGAPATMADWKNKRISIATPPGSIVKPKWFVFASPLRNGEKEADAQ
jgi:hypothetical protein